MVEVSVMFEFTAEEEWNNGRLASSPVFCFSRGTIPSAYFHVILKERSLRLKNLVVDIRME